MARLSFLPVSPCAVDNLTPEQQAVIVDALDRWNEAISGNVEKLIELWCLLNLANDDEN